MKKFTDDQMNDIFDFVDNLVPWDKKNKYTEITPESIVSEDPDIEFDTDVLKQLVGYKVKVETDGTHKNDGQMVEYTFYFKNPKGVVTMISTEMCLMVGWNHWQDEKIL